jgi:hypothetical protein
MDEIREEAGLTAVREPSCFGKYDSLMEICMECPVAVVADCKIKKNPYSLEAKERYGDLVFRLVEQLKGIERAVGRNLLEAGRIFSMFRKDKLYRYYGDHIKTFHQFADEIGWCKTKAYDLADIYDTFGEVLEREPKYLDTMTKTHLKVLLPIVNDDNKEEWLEEAASQTTTGLKNQIASAKNRTPTDECDHSGGMMVIYKCKDCGHCMKVDNPD